LLHNRLFSIGSSTYLTEWNITTGLPIHHLSSNAGAIWSLSPSPDGKFLALGCEDGTIQLIDVEDGEFSYSRFLERQNSRVLSLSWDPKGKFLVGGCADSTIRVWEFPHGRLVQQMKVDRVSTQGVKRKRKMDTIVWSVKVLLDGTVVSGDSTGSLKIWESRFWSLKQSFQVHKADILCLAVDNVFPFSRRLM
jgi:U3 small nucleolar RNA-associated protein 4